MGIGDWGLGPIPNPQSPIPIFDIIYYLLNIVYNIINIIMTVKNNNRN